jgi:hypothetical protein
VPVSTGRAEQQTYKELVDKFVKGQGAVYETYYGDPPLTSSNVSVSPSRATNYNVSALLSQTKGGQ